MASYADALQVVFICQTGLAIIMLIACVPIQESHLPYVLHLLLVRIVFLT
jgi:type III secretory pathway component EscS